MKTKKRAAFAVVAALALALVAAFASVGCGGDKEPEAPTYTVTFAGGGADVLGAVPSAVTLGEGEQLTLPANPFTRDGYVFAGWSDGENTYAAGASYTMPAKDVTITAQWTQSKYTVSFIGGEGATGDAPQALEGAAGTVIELPENTFTNADENKVFDGWTDGENTYAAGAEYTVTDENVTLTAVWAQLYTVSFAGGEGATGNAPQALKGKTGAKVELPANPFTNEDENLVFVGWTDGNKTYAVGAEYTVTDENVTLTAAWEQLRVISFVGGEGATGDAPQELKAAPNATVTLPANPFTNSGKKFVGWKDATRLYAAGTAFTVSKTETLTANWADESKVIVTYLAGEDATGIPPAPVAQNANNAYYRLARNTLTKPGYAFGGWDDGEKTTQANTSYELGTEDVTFTAVWNKISYTVNFAKNGGNATGDAPASLTDKEYGDVITFPENTFTREGWTFTGWKVGYSGAVYQPGDTWTVVGTSATITVNAQWRGTDYTVSFIGGEGATGEQAALTQKHCGDSVTLPACTFVKSGYIFTGWSDGTNTYLANARMTMPNSNVQLTAVWTLGMVNNISDSMIQNALSTGENEITFRIVAGSGKIVDTVYTYSVNGSAVTYTAEDGKTYNGYKEHDVLFGVLPVKTAYSVNNELVVLSQNALQAVTVGTNGNATTMDNLGKLFLFETDNIVVLKVTASDYRSFTAKIGTYAKQADIYTLTLQGDNIPTEVKVDASGVGRFQYSDGYKGTYTQGSATVVLDGYGTGSVQDGGSNVNATYSVMGDMIYLNDEESGDAIYAFDAAAKTIGTSDITSSVSYTIKGESNTVALYISENYVGANTYVELDGGGYYNTFAWTYDEAHAHRLNDGAVYVNVTIGYDTYNGYAYKKVAAVAEGSYVDNLDSAVTAVVAGNTLTLTKTTDGDPVTAEYAISVNDGVIKLGTVTANYVNGVLLFGAKFGTATQTVALSVQKLTSINGVAAGYVVKEGNAAQKMYFYTNNVAISCQGIYKIGSYEADGDVYKTVLSDASIMLCKVTLDKDGVPASYVLGDALAGSYTVTGGILELNGFGGWTLGAESGTYSVSEGFDSSYVLLDKDGAAYKAYEYISYDGVMSEVEGETWDMSAASKTYQTTYAQAELKGITFADTAVHYGSFAIITYTAGGVTKTVWVKDGDVLTLGDNDTQFTASMNDYNCRLAFTTTDGSKAIAYDMPGGVG